MNPYYSDNHITIYNSDCRSMDELPNESVQMVCCSPPYWGLRRYSGEQELIWGGDKDCEHKWIGHKQKTHGGGNQGVPEEWQRPSRAQCNQPIITNTCSLCGAWKGAYGLEPTPEMYIEHTIEILREIRRVLRKDGVVFWNIGDSYYGAKGGGWKGDEHGEQLKSFKKAGFSIKPKDLCLIPFRVAIACQEDGWWVRSVIIWSKPNPMPESVTDRPTESHEYILMLTKSARYYWDADAVREEYTEPMNRWGGDILKANGESMWDKGTGQVSYRDRNMRPNPTGRNLRSVWSFPTQPFPEAHFAVYPEKLPEICIKAATPEVGCCSKCGAPWERVTEDHKEYQAKNVGGKSQLGGLEQGKRFKDRYNANPETLGWQQTCKCNADKVPSIVLDPFAGAGTTLWVAKKLGRRAVGYEISKEYCELAKNRNLQGVML